MLLNDGYICSFCGITFKDDFTYYSLDFIIVQKPKPPLEYLVNIEPHKSIEVCQNCMQNVVKSIVENNKTKKQNICEISGKNLDNNYFYCISNKVIAKIQSNQSCATCGSRTLGKVCKCGSTKFIRQFDINADKRNLEFNVSNDTFNDWIKKSENVNQQNNEWSTKSQ